MNNPTEAHIISWVCGYLFVVVLSEPYFTPLSTLYVCLHAAAVWLSAPAVALCILEQ